VVGLELKGVPVLPNNHVDRTVLSSFYNRAGNVEQAEAAGTKAKILSWGGKIMPE